MHHASKDVTPDASALNPPLFSEKELNEIEEILNRKLEPEPEKHVKINIRASVLKSTNNLPLNQVQDDDPDYISNLILLNDSKENSMRNIFSMTPGSNMDHDTNFSRYEIPFYSNKSSFINNIDFKNMNSPRNHDDSLSKAEEIEFDEKTKNKDKVSVNFDLYKLTHRFFLSF